MYNLDIVTMTSNEYATFGFTDEVFEAPDDARLGNEKRAVESIFENMVKGWFGGNVKTYYNEFINALLNDDISFHE